MFFMSDCGKFKNLLMFFSRPEIATLCTRFSILTTTAALATDVHETATDLTDHHMVEDYLTYNSSIKFDNS